MLLSSSGSACGRDYEPTALHPWTDDSMQPASSRSPVLKKLYRGLAEMSGQALYFRMISSRRPDTGKCPRHIPLKIAPAPFSRRVPIH